MHYKNLFFMGLVAVSQISCTNGKDREDSKDSFLSKEVLLKMVDRAIVQEQFENAENFCSQLITQDPQDLDGWLKLIKLYQKTHEYEHAHESLKKAELLDPENSEVALEMARCLVALHKPKEALARLNKILDRNFHPIDFLDLQGVSLDLLGRHKEAQACYRKGLETSPHNLSLQNNLGLSLALSESIPQAIKILETLVSRSSTPRHRQNLFIAYVLGGYEDKAKKVIENDLDSEAIQKNLNFLRKFRDHSGEEAPLAISLEKILGNSLKSPDTEKLTGPENLFELIKIKSTLAKEDLTQQEFLHPELIKKEPVKEEALKKKPRQGRPVKKKVSPPPPFQESLSPEKISSSPMLAENEIEDSAETITVLQKMGLTKGAISSLESLPRESPIMSPEGALLGVSEERMAPKKEFLRNENPEEGPRKNIPSAASDLPLPQIPAAHKTLEETFMLPEGAPLEIPEEKTFL